MVAHAVEIGRKAIRRWVAEHFRGYSGKVVAQRIRCVERTAPPRGDIADAGLRRHAHRLKPELLLGFRPEAHAHQLTGVDTSVLATDGMLWPIPVGR